MTKARGKSRRVSNGLVGLGSAAVLTIYGAGYLRTRPAAARIALAAERRPLAPAAVQHEIPLPATPVSAPASTPAPAIVAAPPSVPAAAKRASRAPRPATAPAVPARASSALSARASTVSPEAPSAPAPSAEVPPVAAATPESPAVPAAPATPAAAILPTPPAGASTHWKDGTFLGWGSSRHGDIQASVEVRDGRIVSATIAQCLTRYSCSWIAPLPPQVVARQSPETDYVSGATQSTNAFYYAVVDALSKAK